MDGGVELQQFRGVPGAAANIRYRADSGKLEYVHTLNGSGVALARTVLCLLETWQREDGSIELPPAIRGIMGGQERIG